MTKATKLNNHNTPLREDSQGFCVQKTIEWGEVVEYREGRLYWKINTFSGRYDNHPAAVAGKEAGTMKSGDTFISPIRKSTT